MTPEDVRPWLLQYDHFDGWQTWSTFRREVSAEAALEDQEMLSDKTFRVVRKCAYCDEIHPKPYDGSCLL